MNEVPDRAAAAIPPPGRLLRRHTGYSHRYWLALLAFVLLLQAFVVQITFLVSGIPTLPFDDLALDESAAHAPGSVKLVQTTSFRKNGRYAQRVHYHFRLGDGPERQGMCYLFFGDVRAGAPCTIEYLPEAPSVHRMAGTERAPGGWLPVLLLQVPAVLGFLMALSWLRGVFQVRGLLRTGPAVTAGEFHVRKRRWLRPKSLRLDYSFHTSGGDHVSDHQEVLAGTGLGRALLTGAPTVHVIYDESDPRHSRVVDPSDFMTR